MVSELNVDEVVRRRYAEGARERQESLCCPVSYDPRYLEIIPREIIERDYGCGDPTPYLKAGDTALDLGSGAGKVCFIAAQIVGASGKVIGVDINSEMLALAATAATQRLVSHRWAETTAFLAVDYLTAELESPFAVTAAR